MIDAFAPSISANQPQRTLRLSYRERRRSSALVTRLVRFPQTPGKAEMDAAPSSGVRRPRRHCRGRRHG